MGAGKENKPYAITARAFNYSLDAIKLFEILQNQKFNAGWIIGKQYLRSATGIGANIEEAQSGESKADFIHKYGIAQKEARESLYWLRLLSESHLAPDDVLKPLIDETQQLHAIITAIIIRAKM